MKVNDVLHGFAVRSVQELPDIKARLVRMEYQKNGADLVWLDREDDNKTFAITFKTIPQDDTGVFHILEHSVLSGSRKYPVKEPFVELLKSSMNTFLNAFTFPDKTMYPVSSRNDQDFLNLVDVYMDAVLHPLSITNPQAFLQEGWHYELEQAEDELRINGVVYNEMKGAYASSDSVLESEMNRLLFPDNCYGYESGGHPAHIPELTYENYLASHERFYHPSNARIFLDGSVDMDAVLQKLDSFLTEFDRLEVHADIPMQAPVSPEKHCCEYEIGPEEEPENKVILSKGWVVARFDETEKIQAFSALADVLCGSNDAPLKKAVLEQKLADNVELQLLDGIQQPYAVLVVRNTAEAKEEEVWQTVQTVLQQLAEESLDHEQLRAVLNRMEFAAREKDYGRMPRGLVYAMLAQQNWLYGGDPARDLCIYPLFEGLRQKVDQGYFESLLRETLLENPHTAVLKMLPSKTLGTETQQKEAQRLQQLKESWTQEQIADTVARFARFRELQNTPDTPEQRATLPLLSLEDIPEEGAPLRQSVTDQNGVTVLHQDLETDGIVYLELYFSMKDVPETELSEAVLLSSLLGQLDTAHYGALELSAEIDRNLGAFSAAATVLGNQERPDQCEPAFVVRLSVLESKRAEAVRLLDEILNQTSFADADKTAKWLRQMRLGMEEQIAMSGNIYAAARAGASYAAAGAVAERMAGITHFRWMKDWDKRMEQEGAALCDRVAAQRDRLFHRNRLTVSVTGPMDSAWVQEIIDLFPDAAMGETVQYTLYPLSREGFRIPAEIGFAAKASHLSRVPKVSGGAMQVAAQFLTYDYLWSEVRVKGGAYGTGCSASVFGSVRFTSYRDPNPNRSLSVYDGAGEALRGLCDGEEGLTKYIISTIAGQEPVRTPRAEGAYAAQQYLTGQTEETRRTLRHEMLHTTGEELRKIADALDTLCRTAGVCVIGGKEVLDACGDGLDRIETI